MKKYVVYYRVSTKHQGESGLGLDGQRAQVEQYLQANGATEVPPSFTEIESGRKNDRPELRKAINRCKEIGATLLIAKLDRLARNVKFIFTLREELQAAKVDFVALDLPEANTLTLGVLAAFAQHESERISSRLKAAFKAKKARGEKMGQTSWDNFKPEHRKKAHKTIHQNANDHPANRHAFHFIAPRRERGESWNSIAEQLNNEGYRTRRGKLFFAQQVKLIYQRYTKNQKS